MAAKRKPRKAKEEFIADGLEAIKRLLILQLTTSGVKSRDVASALGVHESVISRLLAKRKVKHASNR